MDIPILTPPGIGIGLVALPILRVTLKRYVSAGGDGVGARRFNPKGGGEEALATTVDGTRAKSAMARVVMICIMDIVEIDGGYSDTFV